MANESSRFGPIWFWGLLVALVLIGLSIQGRGSPANQALQQHFALQPTPVNQLPAVPSFSLPSLDLGQFPPELQQVALAAQRRLGQGQTAMPISTTVQSAHLRVDVTELRRVTGGVRVVGEVSNISPELIEVPISAFELRDDTGAVYVSGSGGQATLAPGTSTALDLTAPIAEGRGLLLLVVFPPDPPVEQVLLVASSQ